MFLVSFCIFFFSSRRRHTRCALVTGVQTCALPIYAGGGGQNYPEDYQVIQRLHDADELTVRIAYNLFAQKAGEELSDYERWVAMTEPGAGSAFFRMRSEEHTSELQSLMRISYAVFCLKKKKQNPSSSN